jgi:nitronate monooxygenase
VHRRRRPRRHAVAVRAGRGDPPVLRRAPGAGRRDRHRARGPGGSGLGADLAYVGSAFIATREANAAAAYKQAIVDGSAADIVYTNLFTGVHGNYLRPSIVAAGLDPDALPASDPSKMDFGGAGAKAWKDIWGCGQGIGAIDAVVPAGELVARLRREYDAARAALA